MTRQNHGPRGHGVAALTCETHEVDATQTVVIGGDVAVQVQDATTLTVVRRPGVPVEHIDRPIVAEGDCPRTVEELQPLGDTIQPRQFDLIDTMPPDRRVG